MAIKEKHKLIVKASFVEFKEQHDGGAIVSTILEKVNEISLDCEHLC